MPRGSGRRWRGQPGFAGLHACCDRVVLVVEFAEIDGGAGQERRIAGFLDANLARHLACDNLDVFIVDFDILGAVDLLHLEQDIFVHRVDAVDAENISRRAISLGQLLTCLDVLMLRDGDPHFERDLIGKLLARFGGNDDGCDPFSRDRGRSGVLMMDCRFLRYSASNSLDARHLVISNGDAAYGGTH